MLRRAAAFSVLLAVAIVLGRLTVLPMTNLAVFWPAAGVIVLWLLRTRSSRETALAVGLIAVVVTAGNLLTGFPLVGSLILTVANLVVGGVTRGVLGWLAPSRGPDPTREVVRLAELYRFLLAAAVGVAASGVFGTLAVATAGGDAGWDTFVGWWLRNMTAVVVIAGPFVLVGAGRWLPTRVELLESALVLVASVVLVVWVFGPQQSLPYAFVPFAPIVWAGLRLSMPIAVGQGAVVAVGTLVMVRVFGGGPFGAVGDPGQRALVVQAFMMLAVVLSMVIATIRAQIWDVVDEMSTARARAEDAREDLRILVEALPVALFLVGRDGELRVRNRAAETWLDRDGPRSADTVHIDDVASTMTMSGGRFGERGRPSERALRGERIAGERLTLRDDSGRTSVVAIHAVPLHTSGDGVPDSAVVMWQDVTEEQGYLDRLTLERARSDRLIADAPHGVVVIDAGGRIVRANRALETMFAAPPGAFFGVQVRSLVPEEPERVDAYLDATVAAEGLLIEEEWDVSRLDGEPLQLATSARYLPDEVDAGIIVNIIDISERRRFEERLTYLAEHDVLTGLPNRRQFETALGRHQAICDRYGPRGALLLLDLDHFKEVNDTFGHAAGDQLIAAVGTVLRQGARASDTVARIGGDEFALLLPEADSAEAEKVAGSLVSRIHEHCTSLDGAYQRVSASVGVVTFAAAATHESDAIVLADMLMYDAKEAGRNGYVVFDGTQHRNPRLGARMRWRARIEEALRDDLFELHLQPVLDLATGRIDRAEALLRLRDGDELVAPGRFVYVAESTGLAPALDLWVIRHGIRQLARLQERDPSFTLEVNISARSMGDLTLEQGLREALAESGVDPRTLILEVTETAAVEDVGMAMGFGTRLRSLGVRFALDDFGAGFGSFYYLKHLVFDMVKIDGEFVTDAPATREGRQLLRSIVDVARNLGKGTIAEFVQTEDQLELCRELGVDHAQGFLVGKPVPLRDFVDRYLAEGREGTTSVGGGSRSERP